jgi:hypothetical protein
MDVDLILKAITAGMWVALAVVAVVATRNGRRR